MTTIQINESNFNSLAIQMLLTERGYKFEVKQSHEYGKFATKAELDRIIKTICEYKQFPIGQVKSKYRGGEAVKVKKLYCYIAKTLFPFTADAMLVSVLTIDRSTLTTHKLEVSERINGKLSKIPENVILKNDIENILNLLK